MNNTIWTAYTTLDSYDRISISEKPVPKKVQRWPHFTLVKQFSIEILEKILNSNLNSSFELQF